MIFPIENYIEWSDKYKIKVSVGKCPRCDEEVITNIPFALKGYRGLKSFDHGCGEKYTRKSMVAIGKEEIESWNKSFGIM